MTKVDLQLPIDLHTRCDNHWMRIREAGPDAGGLMAEVYLHAHPPMHDNKYSQIMQLRKNGNWVALFLFNYYEYEALPSGWEDSEILWEWRNDKAVELFGPVGTPLKTDETEETKDAPSD
ncbi:hypothetical protein Rctr85_080 [Virus Rctr85]|nr:hypothetical protein Rctr85_080 [Virus Rctr85]